MPDMVGTVFLNGRFLRQNTTGVQRFSIEITAAIDRLAAAGEWPNTVVLTPPGTGRFTETGAERYQRIELREVGHTQGHLWEQTELPVAARGGILVNLGNTAPVLSGKRQIVVIHDAGVFDTPESYSLRFRIWYKVMQHGLAKIGATVATVSNFSRERISLRLGLDPTQIAVTNEGAEHILRAPSDMEILGRHGLQPGKFIFVVGTGAAHKNLVALREAASMAQRRGLVIAVAGSSARDVFRGVHGIGTTERHLGRVTDKELHALYENAACLLFPSRYEGFGLPPIEAMACGCPVIASRGGAVSEVCGDDALYFVNGEPQSIAIAVERLLDEVGLAESLRERGRKRASKLNWEASARVLRSRILSMQSCSK